MAGVTDEEGGAADHFMVVALVAALAVADLPAAVSVVLVVAVLVVAVRAVNGNNCFSRTLFIFEKATLNYTFVACSWDYSDQKIMMVASRKKCLFFSILKH